MNFEERKTRTIVINKLSNLGISFQDAVDTIHALDDYEQELLKRDYASSWEKGELVKDNKRNKQTWSHYPKRKPEVVAVVDEYTPNGTTSGTSVTYEFIRDVLRSKGMTQLDGSVMQIAAVASIVNRKNREPFTSLLKFEI